ncbi:MAG: hypothetical protein F6K22_18325 [Okeania sp. SIO2F4]|uniref:helix-turn-helix transcriptional regulator n=1 Tax=Okeania sp. SIO2F4 TaxID=2607790 RepID=UPI001429629F|nr:hypothetical protein [Okeania sp. SIO2F4]
MLSNNLQLKTVNFTEKEASVVLLIASGFTDSQISSYLHLSNSYVPTLIKRIIKKYNFSNRCELAAVFVNSFYLSST